MRGWRGLAFALLPAPTGTDLLAILDRVIRRITRRIAGETGDYAAAGDPDPCPDLFAEVQAEAATIWRSPATATSDVVRGTDRLRAWSEGFSLHAGVVIADHNREALERLARYGARPAFAHDRLTWTSAPGCFVRSRFLGLRRVWLPGSSVLCHWM